MPEDTTPAQQSKPTSNEPDFLWVFFDDEIGPARVRVPAGAKVEHIPYYLDGENRYALAVCVDEWCMGLHCGERTHRVITFGDEEGAARLCEVRNEAWRIRTAIQDKESPAPLL